MENALSLALAHETEDLDSDDDDDLPEADDLFQRLTQEETAPAKKRKERAEVAVSSDSEDDMMDWRRGRVDGT